MKETDKRTRQQKLEAIILYIKDNYYRSLALSDAARELAMKPREVNDLISEAFGFTFLKFLKKYRLRRAAQEIHFHYKSLDIIGERNGFASKSFYGEFKKEFGVTPKEFQQEERIPDMPLKQYVNGHPLSLSYREVEDVEVEGIPLRMSKGEKVDLMHEVAWAFRHPSPRVDLHCEEKTWGVWWNDWQNDGQLCYLLAKKVGEDAVAAKSDEHIRTLKTDGDSGAVKAVGGTVGQTVRLRITGGRYAVFQAPRGGDYFNIADTAREMAWYAFRIWQVINWKKTDKMGFTYEVFDSENIYLYIPLLTGFGGIEIENEVGGNNIENIVHYIDGHVLEDIDVDKVAAHFGRSDIYYRDRFQACYGISLPDYITRKRLYVLAQKLDAGELDEKTFPVQCRYGEMAKFRKNFQRAFGVPPEDYRKVSVNVPSLRDYYSEHFPDIRAEKMQLPDRSFLGRSVKSGADKREIDLDVPGVTAFFMEHAFGELQGTTLTEETQKIALYETSRYPDGTYINNFVLGPLLETGDSFGMETNAEPETCAEPGAGLAALPDGFHDVHVQGGAYMVFSIDSAAARMAERIRMLIRCIDHVWIYDNWLQTDFQKRISYFYYDGTNVFYCVPVYE